MQRHDAELQRTPRTQTLSADLVIVGGGLAGVCASITAARAGLRVVLMQDRPVLGGNASSEVRLWALGATSHMGNNNRWAREGGVIDELLVENMYRNPEGNALLFDALLLEKVAEQSNITLLLNTSVFEVEKRDADTIGAVRGFCSQNSTMYIAKAPLFCDASGDGIVGFCAGAAFRMGAETRDEYGEKFAPTEEYGQLLGHSLYFYTKDTGQHVKFVPPSFALTDITRIPRYRQFNAKEHGCQLWWIEYGGRLDTVHDTEAIKWELWRIVYGVWNHIKNSGQFPEADTMTLEWVGTIPGKRESRRFEGDYMLRQQDIVEQRRHDDAVSFGGWAIDLHPADGVFSEKPGCNQWHSKGVYQIPYRCLYSRNITNLFLAGRIISASHIAFGSSRVMLTCAQAAQAVGMAAALCTKRQARPRDLTEPAAMRQLQRELIRAGQYIPHVSLQDEDNLVRTATITASSEMVLDELPAGDDWVKLNMGRAMLLPVKAGPMPTVSFAMRSETPTEVDIELRTAEREGNFTPDRVLAKKTVSVEAAAMAVTGTTSPTLAHSATALCDIEVDFDVTIDEPRYVFVCLMPNEQVEVAVSDRRMTGVLALHHESNRRVATSSVQTPPEDIGVERFEFWLPHRRPRGRNLAMRLNPPLASFGPDQIRSGFARPTTQANAWIADPADPEPTLTLCWDQPQTIRRIEVSFDTDFDHAMETVLMGHPERVMPMCVRSCRLVDDEGRTLAALTDNHQTRWAVTLSEPVTTTRLSLVCEHPSAQVPASVFDVRCYG
ncbi:FAD-dependent oxidoreductase [Planctomycetales bacterium ZRK34]|nr:FAD-dependent oxidoreductase [Planctomycetales bacterium ZRK34]